MIEGFSTYSGSQFLWFYAFLILGAIVAGVWLPRFLRADGANRRVSDRYDIAYLAGGPRRVTETVLAHLMGIGALGDAGNRKLRVVREQPGENAMESALLRKPFEFGITEAHRAVHPEFAAIKDRLVRERLLLDKGERMQLRCLAALPYLSVLAIGFYRLDAGMAEGEPVGFLTAMIVVVGCLAFARFAFIDQRTRGGIAAVAEGRAVSKRLKSAPTGAELGLGVALFGTAILAGTPYSPLYAMQQAATGNDGGYTGDGGGDSGSGDGGCGGGCGGCGG